MNKLLRKLHNEKGMTLAETLMAVLIMSIIFTAVGGGVVVMKNNYEKVTLKAKAQVLLASTISMMNMDLESATSVTTNGNDVISFYSSRRNILMNYIDKDKDGKAKGIHMVPVDSSGTPISGQAVPVVSQQSLSDLLHTEFTTDVGLKFYHDPEGATPDYFEYTICVKKNNGDSNAMAQQTVQISTISPIY